MFPFCSAGRTIGFWKPNELGEECSRWLLREDDGLGLELAEDEASSSKSFLPAMTKDSLYSMRRVWKLLGFSLGRFLDDYLAGLSCFFSDI
ncbi:hypothetical protein Tco_0618528 [Tanacetum coccineum]